MDKRNKCDDDCQFWCLIEFQFNEFYTLSNIILKILLPDNQCGTRATGRVGRFFNLFSNLYLNCQTVRDG